MRVILLMVLILGTVSCENDHKKSPFTTVEVETIYSDSLSIRAIEIMGNSLAFAANKGVFGTIDLTTGKVRSNIQKYHTSIPEFRAVAHTSTDFFMLSVGNPALLYKTGEGGRMELVYVEEGEDVFYDAMTFWNDKEGIAVGDTVDGCLSIIITRNGGNSWKKVSCEKLPKAVQDEGAFAASNTNIKVIGNQTWVATTKRVWYSPDKGIHWSATEDHYIDSVQPTSGIYSIDFYDEKKGIAFGGDYTTPLDPRNNKSITEDGGKTWKMIANGNLPGYRSCVQFIPGMGGKEIVALGFKGISYSSSNGEIWKQLSEEPFYTFRFLNDSVAYAAGKNRISKLTFK